MKKNTNRYIVESTGISAVGQTSSETITVTELNKVMVFEDIYNWKAVRVDDDGKDLRGQKRTPKSCWIYDSNDKYVAFVHYSGTIDFTPKGAGDDTIKKLTEQAHEQQSFDPSCLDELKQAIRYVYLMLKQSSPNH